ncbi:unnamed protein product, partial [Prorocentrum cordatum]
RLGPPPGGGPPPPMSSGASRHGPVALPRAAEGEGARPATPGHLARPGPRVGRTPDVLEQEGQGRFLEGARVRSTSRPAGLLGPLPEQRSPRPAEAGIPAERQRDRADGSRHTSPPAPPSLGAWQEERGVAAALSAMHADLGSFHKQQLEAQAAQAAASRHLRAQVESLEQRVSDVPHAGLRHAAQRGQDEDSSGSSAILQECSRKLDRYAATCAGYSGKVEVLSDVLKEGIDATREEMKTALASCSQKLEEIMKAVDRCGARVAPDALDTRCREAAGKRQAKGRPCDILQAESTGNWQEVAQIRESPKCPLMGSILEVPDDSACPDDAPGPPSATLLVERLAPDMKQLLALLADPGSRPPPGAAEACSAPAPGGLAGRFDVQGRPGPGGRPPRGPKPPALAVEDGAARGGSPSRGGRGALRAALEDKAARGDPKAAWLGVPPRGPKLPAFSMEDDAGPGGPMTARLGGPAPPAFSMEDEAGLGGLPPCGPQVSAFSLEDSEEDGPGHDTVLDCRTPPSPPSLERDEGCLVTVTEGSRARGGPDDCSPRAEEIAGARLPLRRTWDLPEDSRRAARGAAGVRGRPCGGRVGGRGAAGLHGPPRARWLDPAPAVAVAPRVGPAGLPAGCSERLRRAPGELNPSLPAGAAAAARLLLWLCALYWTLDVGLCFRSGFVSGARMVLDARTIAARYAQTWLPFDLVMSAIDWAEVALGEDPGTAPAALALAVRLRRPLRLLRAARIGRSLALRSGFPAFREWGSPVLALAWLAVSCHTAAGAWLFLGARGGDWLDAHLEGEATFSAKLSASTHWAISRLHGSGQLLPRTAGEQALSSVWLLLALLSVSAFLATLTAGATRRCLLAAEASDQRAALCTFLARHEVGPRAQVLLKVHLEAWTRLRARQEGERRLLEALPAPLRAAALWEARGPALLGHHLLRALAGASPPCARELAGGMQVEGALAGDVLFQAGEACGRARLALHGRLAYRLGRPPEAPDAAPSLECCLAGGAAPAASAAEVGEDRAAGARDSRQRGGPVGGVGDARRAAGGPSEEGQRSPRTDAEQMAPLLRRYPGAHALVACYANWFARRGGFATDLFVPPPEWREQVAAGAGF